jgi:endonuclease-3
MTPGIKRTSKRKRSGAASERPEEQKTRARKILQILRKEFPRPATALRHENPFQLLIATILSAQCTDQRVNMVTPGLFRNHPDAAAFAQVAQEDLEQEIRSTGFYHNKAKSIIECSRALLALHAGTVPSTLEALVDLPGVGRKTANVVLGQGFGITSGIVVDTHVHRISQRLGLTAEDHPEKIERDLMEVFQKKDWIDVGSILILHGRRTCIARSPRCESCPVKAFCPSAETFLADPR